MRKTNIHLHPEEKNSEKLEDGMSFWSKVRNQELSFFSDELASNVNLWRLSVPNNAALNIVSNSHNGSNHKRLLL